MTLSKPLLSGTFAIFLIYFAVIFIEHGARANLTDAQEVAQLRAELQKAFEQHDIETVAESGVIVQPKWTQDTKNVAKVNAKVVVTEAGLDEAKALRDEINRAVAKDVFVASVASDVKTTKKLVAEFGMNAGSQNAEKSLLASINENAEDVASDFDDNDVDIDDVDPAAPNIVESNMYEPAEIDVRKLQRLELSKRRTKETLLLKSIEEDYSFDLGGDVDQWAHVVHAGQEYFIGRRITDLLIVQKETAQYQAGKVLEIGYPITYLETYSFWNMHEAQLEGVILVAAQDKVLWYRGDSKTGQLVLYWEWHVGNTISGLTYFTVEANDYLIVSFNESTRAGFYALNVYQFELETKEFWIAQRLQLQFPCDEVTLLDTGRDLILAVPQNNTAIVYTFNPLEDETNHIHFQLYKNIAAVGIPSITGFQMGGRSYLALAGEQPQILLYEQGKLMPKTLLANNFGFVELFFAIPARTYRDDLILLVQHRVDFDTHSVTILETLIWDGEAFEATIPVPCHMGEHTVYGINCMLDIQRDEGLKGAALFRRHNDAEIYIIVPRHNVESGLFRLNIELLAKNSELMDLKDIFEFLQDWVKEQDEAIAQAQVLLNTLENQAQVQRDDLPTLDWVKTPLLNFTGKIDEIYVNDYKWTAEDTKTDLDSVMNAIEQLGDELNQDAERQRRDTNAELVIDMLTIDNVEADEFIFENLNNEKFFIQNGTLTYDGVITVEDLAVLQTAYIKEIHLIHNGTTHIDSDLEFEAINGVLWQDLIKNLIFTNQPNNISNLTVAGDVHVEHSLTVAVLNALNFPDDYLWTNDTVATIISGEKTFTGTLFVNEIDTDGQINDVNPFDAITLNEAQHWRGLPTFAHLEISEKLTLNGTVLGADLKSVPNNPTLQESKIITADCSFEHLKVNGPIYIVETFDNQSLSTLLADVIQRPADPAEQINIPSKKTFARLTFPIDFNVRDNAVNNITLDQFVTADTPQVLNMSVISGYVYIHNLTLNGTFDGVDIAELAKNSIKINAPQYSPQTKLHFVQPLHAKNITVRYKLNGIPIDAGYQTINEDLIMPIAHFEHLQAETAQISNDIIGNASFNGLDLHAFLKRRKWSNNCATCNIFLDELILDDGIVADKIHGIDAKYLLNFLEQIEDLPEMIIDGKVKVDHVIVTGSVEVNKLNGYDFDEDIQRQVIWLNRPNYLPINLTFEQPLELAEDLVVLGTFNGVNLVDFLEDLVFRTTNSTNVIMAPKSFTQDVFVRCNTTVAAINGIPFEEIATTTRINRFKGQLRIDGDLIVDEMEIGEYLNNISMPELARMVRYDQQLEAYVLCGETKMTQQMFLNDLSVHGRLDDIPNMDEFFKNLIYKNSDCILNGNYTFTGRVTIENGVYVRQLNEHNMLELLDNIVLISDPQPVYIQGPVIFEGEVRARAVTVAQALTTCNLAGCAVETWLNDTLRTDRPQEINASLRFASHSLNDNAIFASYLNDIDLSRLLTLHTEQNLTNSTLVFSELYMDDDVITVNGTVNNVDLKEAYENTLMSTGNQHVTTPLTLPTVTVLKNLQTNAAIGGVKDLRQVVTLNDGKPVILQTPLFFKNLTVHSLHTNHLVSGINLTHWIDDALWSQARSNDNSSVVDALRIPRAEVYNKLCRKFTKLWAKYKKRAYYVKSLAAMFQLHVADVKEDRIKKAFVLEHANVNYLLVNMGCLTFVYKWNITSRLYQNLQHIVTGPIDQLMLLPKKFPATTLQFLTHHKSAATSSPYNCTLSGLNTWLLLNDSITQMRHFEMSKFNDIQLLYKPQQWQLYGLTATTLNAFNLSEPYENRTKLWRLTATNVTKPRYRFLPTTASDCIIISDGQAILKLDNDTLQSVKPTYSFDLPLVYPRRHNVQAPITLHKPNATEVASWHINDDYRISVERLLDNLMQRLFIEVNITQLSIPESDLYDAHLIVDFIAIMAELQKQTFYATEMFADIDLSNLQMPDNPAKVLAVRAVQIIWPVIAELKRMQRHLDDNNTNVQILFVAITNKLGVTVHDVLKLAYDNEAAQKRDYVNELTAIIERIALLQRDMNTIVAELSMEIKEELDIENMVLPLTVANNNNETLMRSTSTVAANTEIKHLSGLGEMLRLEVSSATAPRILIAVVDAANGNVSVANDAIKLYMNILTGSLFQTIVGLQQPHALTTLRIRDETLFAFVEDCCWVKVLLYRGVQGFIQFAEFKTVKAVQQLIGFWLPSALNERIYILAAVLHETIDFYEVQVTGLKYTPPGELIACP